MKKALLLLLSLILCFTLVACGENNTPVEDDNVNLPNEEVNDVVTPEDDVTEIISGDDVVENISGDVVEEISGDILEVSGEMNPELEISGEITAE